MGTVGAGRIGQRVLQRLRVRNSYSREPLPHPGLPFTTPNATFSLQPQINEQGMQIAGPFCDKWPAHDDNARCCVAKVQDDLCALFLAKSISMHCMCLGEVPLQMFSCIGMRSAVSFCWGLPMLAFGHPAMLMQR